MTPKFGTGLLPDPRGYLGDGKVKSIGTGDGPESFFGLGRYQRYDLNQSASNSCVWFYLKQALWTLTGVHALPRILLSELAGYWCTRKRQANGGMIGDLGCRPSVATLVLQQQGFCLQEHWPFRLRAIDKEPPFQAFIEMSKRKWFYDRRVGETGQDRCRAIRHLGPKYIPLGIGLTIDEPFVNWKPGDGAWRRKARPVGRHMVTYHAHEPAGVWIVGSYGKENGKNNTVLVSWDVIASDETYPVMAPAIDPKYVAQMLQGSNP